MGEYELLAAIAKKMTRQQAYTYVKYGDHKPFIKAKRGKLGTNRARIAVLRHFELRPEHIVHHEDRNENNNELANLRVFASNSDHVRYHFFDESIKPIWDGSKIND